MTGMANVLDAAGQVQRLCERKSWRFCFIGGVAVQRWGNPRFTADVDFTLLTGYGTEDAFIDELLAHFEPRRPDAREFALLSRVLLARTKGGIDIDVSLGALPFEERSVERSSLWDVKSVLGLRTCSAEDLVVHKVFAGRDRDWDDVRGILARQHGTLNFTLVREELLPLLELNETPEALERFDRLVREVEKALGRRGRPKR
jgi:hypothetical protein